jgi:inosine/xanthosine triphosphatase
MENITQPIRVIVGSTNPTKVRGVKLAFEQFFDEVDIVEKDVESGVPPQPFDGETLRGAIERAKKSYEGWADFSVGIEAGLFKVDRTITGYVDFQVAAVYDGTRVGIGFGPGFEYPPSVVEEVISGKEVGEVMEAITGIEDLGKKFGAVYYLTKGAVSRSDLSKLAVTMALIPFINFERYFL